MEIPPRVESFLSVDSVQAGVGDLVLAAREGNAARQVLGTDKDPITQLFWGLSTRLSLESSDGEHGTHLSNRRRAAPGDGLGCPQIAPIWLGCQSRWQYFCAVGWKFSVHSDSGEQSRCWS